MAKSGRVHRLMPAGGRRPRQQCQDTWTSHLTAAHRLKGSSRLMLLSSALTAWNLSNRDATLPGIRKHHVVDVHGCTDEDGRLYSVPCKVIPQVSKQGPPPEENRYSVAPRSGGLWGLFFVGDLRTTASAHQRQGELESREQTANANTKDSCASRPSVARRIESFLEVVHGK
jgi:hypothetical protein